MFGLNIIKKWLFANKSDDTSNIEELRREFESRHHNFKLLLNANNRALENMAAIEKVLQNRLPFTPGFIKNAYRNISSDVRQMIDNLENLAPGKYQGLIGRFNEIRRDIEQIFSQDSQPEDDALAIPLASLSSDLKDMAGNKMARLGDIKNDLNLNVPEGFVITAAVHGRFMKDNRLEDKIDSLLQSVDFDNIDKMSLITRDIKRLVMEADFTPYLKEKITQACREHIKKDGGSGKFILRSSSAEEDSSGVSFAGQYKSELNVDEKNIFQSYKKIIAAKYGMRAMIYQRRHGLQEYASYMGVGCMRMVGAVAGGVIYSANPLNSNDDSILVYAVRGSPKSIVNGTAVADRFVLHKNKSGKISPNISGINQNQVSINWKQAIELAEIAVRLEKYYKAPQDVEWLISGDGKIYILQARPLRLEDEKLDLLSLITIRNKPQIDKKQNLIFKGGNVVYPGAACGPVRIVKKGSDIAAFPSNSILVASQALPRWAVLLHKASAIISEQGSFAGHLANVAREFKVPALFGAAGIIGKLKNGDMITVDARQRAVYQGKAANLLTQTKPRENFQSAPAYHALNKVADRITPLSLLDPESEDFSPLKCETFHDITRFVHEKSVGEMFSFGKDHHFSERSSKQLVYDVPMQWWVLNLNDGFKKEVNGKYVQLDNISSVPMLAIWEGIIAIPWEGPPPVNAGGFMSVMFQATVNRDMTPWLPSSYTEKNYFMISRNYCALTSRLGVHLSTVESLINGGDAAGYISFHYRGGAAGYKSRLKRVFMLSDILEEHNFNVAVKGDALVARLENKDAEFIKKHLKILGYLTMHSRQLDMVMSSNSSIYYYRKKFTEDINRLVKS